MNIYKTSEVAHIVGIHPNTVRLYEELGLLSLVERQPNGYRIYTDFHIEQLRLARTAFKIEVLQNGLRKKIVKAIKASANGEFDKAIVITNEYLTQVYQEQENAEEAINIAKQILQSKESSSQNELNLKRKEVSEYLGVSMDTLRNWELNGLLKVKRKQNGYRFYTEEDINQLKMIRSLRCANYSLEAILRMINALSIDPQVNIKKVLNTSQSDTDVISVCDKLIFSLHEASQNAERMIDILIKMKIKFKNPPF